MDSEPVCPMPALREACVPKCQETWKLYEACKVRIAAKGSGDCESWYFDYLKCIDKCSVPAIGKHLK